MKEPQPKPAVREPKPSSKLPTPKIGGMEITVHEDPAAAPKVPPKPPPGPIERALEAAGFPRERREFAPHLTLARVRPESARALAPRIAEALQAVRAPQAELEVRKVSLMQSTLQKGGAIYQQLATFALE